MRIRWTPAAAAELQGICDYLKEYEPHLARPTVIEIRKFAHSLKKFLSVAARDARKERASCCTGGCRISSPTA
jgi:plasmid stabilization system protein ParE